MTNYREGACDACNSGTLDVNPCTCIDWQGRAEKAERELAEARGDSPSGFWSQREWEDWSNELAGLIHEDDESIYSNPEGAQESIILDVFRVYSERRTRDAE